MLDENVRLELYRFLKREGYDVKLPPKGVTDRKIAFLSKVEKRILVTNDSDFSDLKLYSKEELFAVVWLRLLQSESEKLIFSFTRLLSEFKGNYEGKLFFLEKNCWEVHDLSITIEDLN